YIRSVLGADGSSRRQPTRPGEHSRGAVVPREFRGRPRDVHGRKWYRSRRLHCVISDLQSLKFLAAGAMACLGRPEQNLQPPKNYRSGVAERLVRIPTGACAEVVFSSKCGLIAEPSIALGLSDVRGGGCLRVGTTMRSMAPMPLMTS